jgi:hypothetical protein
VPFLQVISIELQRLRKLPSSELQLDMHMIPAIDWIQRAHLVTWCGACGCSMKTNKTKFFRKRRGRLAGLLYKLILLQAALAPYLLGEAIWGSAYAGTTRRSTSPASIDCCLLSSLASRRLGKTC